MGDRKSTRLNSSHLGISYAVFCLKKKKRRNCYRHFAGQTCGGRRTRGRAARATDGDGGVAGVAALVAVLTSIFFFFFFFLNAPPPPKLPFLPPQPLLLN